MVSKIQRVYELAQTTFIPFTGFSSDRFVSGTYHPEALPALETFKGHDIQEIRQLCGPKDKVFTEICSVNLSADNYANVIVTTRRKGHRFCFSLRMPEDTNHIREKLGVKIKKGYFV